LLGVNRVYRPFNVCVYRQPTGKSGSSPVGPVRQLHSASQRSGRDVDHLHPRVRAQNDDVAADDKHGTTRAPADVASPHNASVGGANAKHSMGGW
jgi:hypothetical protein